MSLVAGELESCVNEFNERATLTSKTAQFALDHGLRDRCREELEKSAECLLSYGHHKDSFVFEVLGGLKLLADDGEQEARKTFLSLTPEIESIVDYTDGDATTHARTEYYEGIVKWFPERLPKLYSELIDKEEWYRAEQVLKLWAKCLSDSSATDRALLTTLIVPAEFNIAWQSAGAKDDGTSIREALRQLTGRDGPSSNVGRQTSRTRDNQPREEIDFNEFEPGCLSNLIHSLRESSTLEVPSIVSEWLIFWDTRSRHVDALADLKSILDQNGIHVDVREAIDAAFDISLRKEGRSKAYNWLVRAMVENRGWSKWWSNEERFRKRIQIVSQQYRSKWKEFITDTSFVEPIEDLEENGITVGFSRLVYFLVEVGETEMAKDCVMEMVEIFRSEVSQQPLKAPSWIH